MLSNIGKDQTFPKKRLYTIPTLFFPTLRQTEFVLKGMNIICMYITIFDKQKCRLIKLFKLFMISTTITYYDTDIFHNIRFDGMVSKICFQGIFIQCFYT